MSKNSIASERVVKQLSHLLDDIETLHAKLSKQVNRETLGNEVDPSLIAQLGDLTRQSLALSKEARAWAKTNKEVGQKLTLAERVELTVQFIAKLSSADRRDLLARFGWKEGPQPVHNVLPAPEPVEPLPKAISAQQSDFEPWVQQ